VSDWVALMGPIGLRWGEVGRVLKGGGTIAGVGEEVFFFNAPEIGSFQK